MRKKFDAFHKAMNFILNLPSLSLLILWIGRRVNRHSTSKSYYGRALCRWESHKPSLVPDSIIRRQEAASSTLDSGKSDLTHSYFNDSYFEEHVDGSDLSEQNEYDLEESVAGGLSNHCGKDLQQPMDQGLFPSRVNQGKGQIIS